MEKSNWRSVIFMTMLLIVSLIGISGVVSSERTRNPGYFSSDLSLTGMDQDYDGYDETVKIEITVKNSNSWYDSSCEVSADLLLNSYVIDTTDHSFNLDNGLDCAPIFGQVVKQVYLKILLFQIHPAADIR